MLRKRDLERSVRVALRVCAVLIALQALVTTAQGAGDLSVADGLKVTLEYTLSLSDQSVVDSNVGQTPFTFTQGAHEIVPGLEKSLVGMKAGEKKHVEVPAAEGYGPYDKKARTTVELTRLPQNLRVGDVLQGSDGRLVKVLELNEKTAVLDLNHPLAGKNLTFDVTVVNVEKPPADSPATPRP
ncbi:FKBP-type peptidyl-prolyl cis-trans isomerase [Nitrospira sp. Nam80]